MKYPVLGFAVLLWAALAGEASGDRLYFTGMVEENPDTAARQVILAWGPMERAIPSELTGFRLYRRQAPDDFALIAETTRGVADLASLTALFMEPGESHRFADLVEWADDDTAGEATGTAAIEHLHMKLSLLPGDPMYNPLEQLLLARYNYNAARGLGQGYIDRNLPGPGVYEYMLTGMEGNSETLPLGQTAVDISVETILPAFSDFKQVFVADCSAISRGVDDRRIHLRWNIPMSPDALPLRILTYGYDIYRSDSDLGPLDLRSLSLANAVPEELTLVNDEPVVVAGNPPEEGRDSFMAIDEGDPFHFDFLRRGQTYFYYLVGKDLSGKYSMTSGPILAMVPDSLPPPAPWNVRSEEVWDPVMPELKRIQIVWDEIDPVNYWREFGSGFQMVEAPSYANPLELYFVPDGTNPVRRNHREVDLETMKYVLFRFDTQEAAQSWGTDSDGDYWPDNIELDMGTDPCNAMSHPAGNPPELVTEIDVADTSNLRTLETGLKQRFFIDTVPQPDNKVYWYKMIAIDSFGNQSPLSPPVRGVLWDREQPDANGGIVIKECTYRVVERLECEVNEQGPRFRAFDETQREEEFGIAEMGFVRIYNVCPGVEGQREGRVAFVAERPIRNREATFFPFHFDHLNCQLPCFGDSTGILVFRYYDKDGNLIATSKEVTLTLCAGGRVDCFDLIEECREREPGPGEVIPTDATPTVCVDLEPGQRARVYHLIGGDMSPFLTISATQEVGVVEYCEDLDLAGIVPTNTCLGIRVFNSNNVGSSMKFLNCIGLGAFDKQPPAAPLLHSVDPTGTEGSPTFTVRWAAQGQSGLAAFVLSWKQGVQIRYNTFWINSADLSYKNGLYEVVLPLDPVMDVNVEWCFEVRAVDKVLQSSGWSPTLCNTWELGDPEQLPWPPVPDIPAGEDLTVFFLFHPLNAQPLLVLSGSIDIILSDQQCVTSLDDCQNRQEPCLEPVNYTCSGFCDKLKAANRYGRFIVYRQTEGKDFVQVGPLVDTFFCYRGPKIDLGSQSIEPDILDDPYIYLVNPDPMWVLPNSIESEVSGPRLVYADPYPLKAGTMVRYQLVQVDPVSGEGVAVHYSQWLEIP